MGIFSCDFWYNKKVMNIQHSFYEDEVRCDFFIPSMIKRTWAASIVVLQDIDDLCRRHNIKYFAEWGTLLGAVRHGGFIPWDDDLDICMKRKDYDRFIKIAKQELPDNYSIVNFNTSGVFKQMLTRVVSADHYRFDTEYLSRYSFLPFAMGIDIFPLDFISDDEEYENARFEKCYLIQLVIDLLEKDNKSVREVEDKLCMIEKACGITLNRNDDLPRALRNLMEDLYREVDETRGKYITLYPIWFSNHSFRFPKKYYSKSIRLPFENITIPVPVYYNDILSGKYGNGYMNHVRSGGAHDYPCYQKHIDVLKEHFDFEWPHYDFSMEDITHSSLTKSPSFNDFAEYIFSLMGENISYEECQQLAITLGTLIEKRYGEGSKTVGILEKYCEKCYECSTDALCPDSPAELLMLAKEEFKTELSNKKLILYISFSYRYADFLLQNAKEKIASADNNTIIKIMPISRREYDLATGNYNLKTDFDEYPDNLPYVSDDDMDLRLIHPDEIIYNYPYDGINLVASADEKYYSKALCECTDKLTFITPFPIKSVSLQDERSAKNIHTLINTPLTAVCDEIILNSEDLREMYKKVLRENESKEIADAIISKLSVYDYLSQNGTDNSTTAGKNSHGKSKVLLYYIGINSFLSAGEDMLKKLDSFVQTILINKGITVIYTEQIHLRELLKSQDEGLYNKYIKFCSELTENHGDFFSIHSPESLEEAQILSARSDAFYGEACCLVAIFSGAKKPVMIHNPKIL